MSAPRGCSLSRILTLAVVLATAVATCGGQAAIGPSAAGACPYRTPAEWQAFLDRWAADGRWLPTCEDGGCDRAFYDEVDADVRAVFDRCADVIAGAPALDDCTSNLRRFTPGWMARHTPDGRARIAAQEPPGAPAGMMIPPEPLARAVPDVEEVIRAAREHGWPYVVQESAVSGARIVVVVADPGGRFDQWVMLDVAAGAPDRGAARAVDVARPLSLLAAQKKDAAGDPLPRPRLRFVEYALAPAPAGGYALAHGEGGSAKCDACHAGGARRILPRRTAILDARPVRGEPGFGDATAPADFALQRIGELNARLDAYGLPDEGGIDDARSLGPALGKSAGCTECHNGRARSRINGLSSTPQNHEQVVHDLAMPPDPALIGLLERSETRDPALGAGDERALREATDAHRRIAAALQASRPAALREWLLETRCE